MTGVVGTPLNGSEKEHDEKLRRMTESVKRIITGLGEDITREGLIDTPKRVSKALLECTLGYKQRISSSLHKAVFNEPIVYAGGNGIVIVRDIDFASVNEENFLPFHGRCHVGYVPSEGRVLGLSKMARLVRQFSKRLQSQNRLTQDLAVALLENFSCQGCAVVVHATHLSHLTNPQKRLSVCTSGCFSSQPSTCLEDLFCSLDLEDVPASCVFDAADSSYAEPSSSSSSAGGSSSSIAIESGSGFGSLSSLSTMGQQLTNDSTSENSSDSLSENSSDRADVDVDVVSFAPMGTSSVGSVHPTACTASSSSPDSAAVSSGSLISGNVDNSTNTANNTALPSRTRGDMEAAVNELIFELGEDVSRPGLRSCAQAYISSLLCSTSGYQRSLLPQHPSVAAGGCITGGYPTSGSAATESKSNSGSKSSVSLLPINGSDNTSSSSSSSLLLRRGACCPCTAAAVPASVCVHATALAESAGNGGSRVVAPAQDEAMALAEAAAGGPLLKRARQTFVWTTPTLRTINVNSDSSASPVAMAKTAAAASVSVPRNLFSSTRASVGEVGSWVLSQVSSSSSSLFSPSNAPALVSADAAATSSQVPTAAMPTTSPFSRGGNGSESMGASSSSSSLLSPSSSTKCSSHRCTAVDVETVYVPFVSQCEHHMLPFYGTVMIAVGRPPPDIDANVSTVDDGCNSEGSGSRAPRSSYRMSPRPPLLSDEAAARVVSVFTQRLQVQERITHQVADAVAELLLFPGGVSSSSSSTPSNLDHNPRVAPSSSNHNNENGDDNDNSNSNSNNSSSSNESMGNSTDDKNSNSNGRAGTSHGGSKGIDDADGGNGWVMVTCEAAHMCMVARGIESHSGFTLTYATRGDGALKDLLLSQDDANRRSDSGKEEEGGKSSPVRRDVDDSTSASSPSSSAFASPCVVSSSECESSFLSPRNPIRSPSQSDCNKGSSAAAVKAAAALKTQVLRQFRRNVRDGAIVANY